MKNAEGCWEYRAYCAADWFRCLALMGDPGKCKRSSIIRWLYRQSNILEDKVVRTCGSILSIHIVGRPKVGDSTRNKIKS